MKKTVSRPQGRRQAILGGGVQDFRELAENGKKLVSDATTVVDLAKSILTSIKTDGLAFEIRGNALVVRLA